MRCDGTRVRDADPMYFLIPQFLTKRYDSMNMITLNIPLEPMRNYMNAKRAQGRPVSHLALIIASYLRMAAEFPRVNRFISGNRKIYDHNDFTVSMVVLRPGDADDTMSKIKFEYTDTIFDVQRKITEYIDTNRNVEKSNALDRVMRVFCRNTWLMGVGIGLIRFLDKHGWLPRFLVDASPFHASLLVSNLASIRTNHIYHHVYEFGTTSVAITMGNMREIPKTVRGEITLEKCMPLGVVMDERICSGHYFAQAFMRMKEYLKDPTILESSEIPARSTAAVK